MSRSNRNYGKLTDGVIKYAPNAIVTDDEMTLNPTNEQYLAAGWKRVTDTPPETDAAHYAEANSWEETDGELVRVYVVREIVKAPRVFSRLKMYLALAKAGLWDGVESWLKAQTIEGISLYMAFNLANEISEDHELFAPFLKSAQTALGVDDATVEAILNASVLEV